jgi:hypothetical protein
VQQRSVWAGQCALYLLLFFLEGRLLQVDTFTAKRYSLWLDVGPSRFTYGPVVVVGGGVGWVGEMVWTAPRRGGIFGRVPVDFGSRSWVNVQ